MLGRLLWGAIVAGLGAESLLRCKFALQATGFAWLLGSWARLRPWGLHRPVKAGLSGSKCSSAQETDSSAVVARVRLVVDFRSDRMESPEGRGIARRAWDSYAGAVEQGDDAGDAADGS